MNSFVTAQRIVVCFFAFLIIPLAHLFAVQNLDRKTILLTGGTGYIGSHIAAVLLQNEYNVVLVDNLSNSEPTVIANIEAVAGKPIKNFYPFDLLDQDKLRLVFDAHKIDAVIHLAGFKAVGESVEKPLVYYRNNLISTISLLEVMQEYGCHRLIFSSSATVYGQPQYLPLDEKHPVSATSPYGRTKLMIEEILKDVAAADKNSQVISLRYFNPVGAHASGLIGEKPTGVPQNLLPYMMEVLQGKRSHLSVYGNDYETPDGTAVRDYIHVMDLADGHVLALNTMFGANQSLESYRVYNLGTQAGYSVKQMIDALCKVSGRQVPYEIVGRRNGDVAVLVANPAKAIKELGFCPVRGLDEMMKDSLTWTFKE